MLPPGVCWSFFVRRLTILLIAALHYWLKQWITMILLREIHFCCSILTWIMMTVKVQRHCWMTLTLLNVKCGWCSYTVSCIDYDASPLPTSTPPHQASAASQHSQSWSSCNQSSYPRGHAAGCCLQIMGMVEEQHVEGVVVAVVEGVVVWRNSRGRGRGRGGAVPWTWTAAKAPSNVPASFSFSGDLPGQKKWSMWYKNSSWLFQPLPGCILWTSCSNKRTSRGWLKVIPAHGLQLAKKKCWNKYSHGHRVSPFPRWLLVDRRNT